MPESREHPPPSFLSAVGVAGQYDISYGEDEQKKVVFTDKDRIRTISSRSPRRKEEVMSLGGHTRCNKRQEGQTCDRHITSLSSVKCARDVARKEDNLLWLH